MHKNCNVGLQSDSELKENIMIELIQNENAKICVINTVYRQLVLNIVLKITPGT